MNTQLSMALQGYEDRIKGKFKPDRRFYTAVGINQKRFGQLVRGTSDITRTEILALSRFFEIPVTDLL
jgi:hypothetical protein